MQDTAGEAGTNSSEMYSYGPPHMAVQKQDDQHEHTFSSNVRIRDVVLKTYLGRWTIGRSGERGSGISVLPARYDDDDDDDLSSGWWESEVADLTKSDNRFKIELWGNFDIDNDIVIIFILILILLYCSF